MINEALGSKMGVAADHPSQVGDMVMVTKPDRVLRSAPGALQVCNRLQKCGATFDGRAALVALRDTDHARCLTCIRHMSNFPENP